MFATAKRPPTTPAPTGPDTSYERHRAAVARREASASAAGRDIGEIPAVKHPNRRAKALRSLRAFCETYLAGIFELAWSKDHLTVLAKLETAIRHGGLFALAMPRGSGKTSLAEAATLWSVIAGHRHFVALIGSDESAAAERLDSIKIELETNDDLLADFPEVCYPIRKLERITNRCKGQTCQGRPTYIHWTAHTLRLPTIPHKRNSGAIITTAGITGRIRGMNYKTPSGRTLRPNLAILDDPQTDESARSLTQTDNRETIITGAILGLAGPGKKMAAVMPCTVISKGDLADRFLNHQTHPEWTGERMKLVYAWPPSDEAKHHWDTYADIRATELSAGRTLKAATEYYAQHRAPMDAGAAIAWPARHNPDELSALQHAQNLRLTDEHAFAAEYQNEPKDRLLATPTLTAGQIAASTNAYPPRTAPLSAAYVTGFIDVQARLLWYILTAWASDFTGYVLDYGAWPAQRRNYYTMANATRTLAHAYPARPLEAQLAAGLADLANYLLAPIKREDGADIHAGMILVDANWGASTNTVYTFCRTSPHAARLMPSHGRYIGASATPIDAQAKTPGDRTGPGWKIPGLKSRRQPIRYVTYDTNHWKTFIHGRLAAPPAAPGALTLYAADRDHHRLLADHLSAEYRTPVTSKTRTTDEWRIRPERPDNHLLDGLTGAAVAASILGATLTEHAGQPTARPAKRKTRVSYL